jgi:Tol biopolymer transport system component
MNIRRAALAALAAALMITSVAAAVAADVQNPEQFFGPTWSPDGRKIAFVGDGVIYVMNADGSGKRRLTPNAAHFRPDFGPDFGPAWSPDGRKIAFDTLRHAGPHACSDGYPSAGCNREIYVMNADGSGQRRLTRDPGIDQGVTWSPDGRELLFHRAKYPPLAPKRGALSGFYVMNADGSGQRRLAAATGTAAWSPDGRMIAFRRGTGNARDVYVINADGSGLRRLTHSPGMDLDPTWSPDGRKIAFVSRRKRCPSAPDDRLAYVCGNAEIYVMNADGTGQRNLTRSPAYGYYSSAAWSPDGRKMAFVSDRDGNAEIYVMNADGSAQRRLTRNPASDADPVWSPDGRKIAFVNGAGQLENSGVYVMNADGSGQRRLTQLGP